MGGLAEAARVLPASNGPKCRRVFLVQLLTTLCILANLANSVQKFGLLSFGELLGEAVAPICNPAVEMVGGGLAQSFLNAS